MDYLSYGYALTITLGGVIGYVKAGKHLNKHCGRYTALIDFGHVARSGIVEDHCRAISAVLLVRPNQQ